VDPFIIHLKTGPGDLFSVSTTGMTGSAESGPGRAEFAAAESSEFSQIMGSEAPGRGSEGKNDKSSNKSDKKKEDSKSGNKDKEKGR
jgi:hypothetical protein